MSNSIMDAGRRAGCWPATDITSLAKALAICLVVITHADWTDADRLRPVFPYIVNSAVPLFMMVTGLNFAQSYRRKRVDSLTMMYDPLVISHRISILVLPFIPVFLLEIALALLKCLLGFSSTDLSFAELLIKFLSGGWGPGGYYLPVMIQVVLIYPLLYCTVCRYGWIAFAGISVTSFMTDAILTGIGFPAGAWRLLCIRYLPYLAFGVLLARGRRESENRCLQNWGHLAFLTLGGGGISPA